MQETHFYHKSPLLSFWLIAFISEKEEVGLDANMPDCSVLEDHWAIELPSVENSFDFFHHGLSSNLDDSLANIYIRVSRTKHTSAPKPPPEPPVDITLPGKRIKLVAPSAMSYVSPFNSPNAPTENKLLDGNTPSTENGLAQPPIVDPIVSFECVD